MLPCIKNIISRFKKNKKKDMETIREEYFNSAEYIIAATIFHCRDQDSHKTTIPILSSQ